MEFLKKAVSVLPETTEAALMDVFGTEYMRLLKPIFINKLAELFGDPPTQSIVVSANDRPVKPG